jgi:hypothetical protein
LGSATRRIFFRFGYQRTAQDHLSAQHPPHALCSCYCHCGSGVSFLPGDDTWRRPRGDDHGGRGEGERSPQLARIASMAADPASADTTPATLRALHTHGLLNALVRELTTPTPYGPDGDSGSNCDTDLAEKLTRWVSSHNMWDVRWSRGLVENFL